MIKVAATQITSIASDKAKNLSKIESYCESAATQGVQIVAFPEMAITGYWHVRNLDRRQIEDLAESVPEGPSTQVLARIAKRYGLIVGAGLIEKSVDGRLFNAYVVVQPDGETRCHRKMHCFISEHMSSGDAFNVFDTHLGVKIGVLICYDNNLIENVRVSALLGADILLAPHQTGGCHSRSPHAMGLIEKRIWENRNKDPEAVAKAFQGPKGREWLMRWLPSRAHDNGLFIVFSNGVGLDDDEVRTGNAMVIDCYGRIINETTKIDEDLVIADIDTSLLGLCTGRRWIRGRRPELYSKLIETTGEELPPREARFSKDPTSI